MNIRDAILKAADHLEKNPADYSFWRVFVPECGTPGCMLGWIHAFSGSTAGTTIDPSRRLGVSSGEFYRRILKVSGEFASSVTGRTAPRALRLYADKYHPAEERTDYIPASVRKLFDVKEAA